MAYNITEFFKKIGAPMTQPRWSWGGRRADGVLVFRCWSNVPAEFNYSKRECLMGYGVVDTKSAGYPERCRMVAEFLAGARGYVVFGEATPGCIKTRSLNMDSVFPIIGHRLGDNGEVWVKFGKPIPARELMS